MDFVSKLNEILEKYSALEASLMAPDIDVVEMTSLMKQKSIMEELVTEAKRYLEMMNNLAELEEIIADQSLDAELKDECTQEIFTIKGLMPKKEREIKILLLPKDEMDEKNAIVEVRPCAGGDEAGLFAFELFSMYKRLSERHGWRFETMSQALNDVGGLKEGMALISGKNVFAKLKFESGVHRVQRVPKTEGNGRIHTSTASVAVLPDVDKVVINIPDSEIKVDVYRSSGAGGQHVNTTDSAVRMTHIPTGIVVTQQDEKSQIKNREKAKKILLAKIYALETDKKRNEIDSKRRNQIGTGDRSEKIRTYNYPQDRITDHRINATTHDVVNVVKNGTVDTLIEQLIQEDELASLIEYGLENE